MAISSPLGSRQAVLQWWPSAAVIPVAATLVAGAAGAFMTAILATARRPSHRAPRPALQP